jgi:site-specific DNA-methyltransferase (adenine-specific)
MESVIHHGDCLDVMRGMAGGSVDSVVTDPPYGLSFMGKKWDYDVPGVGVWAECLRVLKPGGHLLAFSGTRTYHRMVCAVEDAGFEIRDQIGWVYGSGFPKSHNLDGAWQGWGTALKPAWEPIVVARKPLIGTVAANVLAHGTGAMNIDGCRVEGAPRTTHAEGNRIGNRDDATSQVWGADGVTYAGASGRWPANIIHDGSDEVLAAFPQSTSGSGIKGNRPDYKSEGLDFQTSRSFRPVGIGGDTGSAARFFYCAKASKKDRGDGNTHPTVKPTDLMRYLCRLVTPPGGVVLDPFAGSGSTGKAAAMEGFRFIGIEREAEYFKLASERLGRSEAQRQLI